MNLRFHSKPLFATVWKGWAGTRLRGGSSGVPAGLGACSHSSAGRRALRGRAVLSPGLLWAAPWASGEASLPRERLEVGRSLAWL